MAVNVARDLTTGSIPRHAIALAIPAVISALVHNLYGLNDVFFSRFVGDGLAAQTAISNNLFTLIQIFGFIQVASIGTLTLVSRRTGAANHDGADQAARQGLIFAAVVSVITAGIGLATLRLIPVSMGMAEDVAAESISYLRVIFLGLPLMFFPPVLDSIFRARGDARTPLLLHLVSVTMNVAGNALAVFVLDLGTTGIALSTLLSRGVWVIAGLIVIRRGRIGIRLLRRPGKWADLPIWGRIARISAPIAARAFLFGSIYQLVSRITSGFGSEAQNGLGVGIRLEGLCFMIMVGFGMAAGPLVGQNLGAGKPDRAERAAWITAAMACVPAVLFSLLFYFAPHFLMSVMTEDGGSLGHGVDYLRIVSICMVFTALEVVLAQGFVGAGDTLPPAVVDIPITAMRVPLAAWLSSYPEIGVAGIWWTIAGTAIARGVFMALWFKRGKWKRARPDLDK